jgi:DNA-binding transcriptional ArsR family regulator
LSAARIGAAADVGACETRRRSTEKEVTETVSPFADEETGMTIPHPLSADLVELIAERFDALSEPVRIRLLDRLRDGEATVLSLTAAIGTTPQNVSKHLAVLRRAGIIARRKQGNFAYYSIADERVFELCETVCGSLERQVESLGQVVVGARSD